MTCHALLRRCANALALQVSTETSGVTTASRSVTSGSTSGSLKRFYDQATVAEAKGRPVRLLQLAALSGVQIEQLMIHSADSGALGCPAGWEACKNTNHGASGCAQPSAGLCDRSRVPVSEPRICAILVWETLALSWCALPASHRLLCGECRSAQSHSPCIVYSGKSSLPLSTGKS